MGQNRRAYVCALALLCCAMLLCACGKQKEEVVQPVITTVSFVGEPLPDLAALMEQKDLLFIDLSGHDVEAAQIETLREALPNCEVIWTIDLSGEQFDGDAESIRIATLREEDLPKLKGFPNLTAVDARGSECIQALSMYAAEHPELDVTWSVQIGAVEVLNTDTWLDLNGQALPKIAVLIERLEQMPQLTDVSLVGCELSLADKAMLKELYPDIQFYWTVELGGKQYKNTETRLDLNAVNIADTAELAQIVSCFPNLEWVDVSTLGFASVDMEEICRQFPDTVFAWTIKVGNRIVRTDATVFNVQTMSGGRLRNEHLEELKYCTQLRAVNLAGQSITDISVLANLPNLEVLIISRNSIRDLSPLSGLKKLHYLEAYENEIADVAPLAALPQLYDLNLMYNEITDLSPLASLTTLQRGYFAKNKLSNSASQQTLLTEALPNATLNFKSTSLSSWRNHDRYDMLDHIWSSLHMLELYPELTADAG